MPPQKKDKKKHYRGKTFTNFEEGGGGVPSRDAVEWRNKQDWKTDNRRPRDKDDEEEEEEGENNKDKKDKDEDQSSSSDEDEENEKKNSKNEKSKEKDPKKEVEEDLSKKMEKDLKISKDKKGEESHSDDDNPVLFERLNTTMNPDDDQLASGPLSRKQREELEKEAKRKRYEKLHREGKTDEAKSDLARLAKIKAEREAKAKLREEEERKKKEEEGGGGYGGKDGKVSKEYLSNLGGGVSKKVGGGSKKDKKKKKDSDDDGDSDLDQDVGMFTMRPGNVGKDKTTTSSSSTNTNIKPSAPSAPSGPPQAPRLQVDQAVGMYSAYTTEKKPEEIDRNNVVKGSIEACRAEEDDFM